MQRNDSADLAVLRRHLGGIREEHARTVAAIDQAKRRRADAEASLARERDRLRALARGSRASRNELAREARRLADAISGTRPPPACVPDSPVASIVVEIAERAKQTITEANSRIAAACRISDNDGVSLICLAIEARLKSLPNWREAEKSRIEKYLWQTVLHTMLRDDMQRQVYMSQVAKEALRVLGQYASVIGMIRAVTAKEQVLLSQLLNILHEKSSLLEGFIKATCDDFISDSTKPITGNSSTATTTKTTTTTTATTSEIASALCAAANAVLDGDSSALIPSKELVQVKIQNLNSKGAELSKNRMNRQKAVLDAVQKLATMTDEIRKVCAAAEPCIRVDDEAQCLGQFVSALSKRVQETCHSAISRPSSNELRYATQRAREISQARKRLEATLSASNTE